MVVDVQPGRGGGDARAPPPALKSVRPKLFRRASLTSWGKDNLRMTRSAAVNLKELMLTVQQQKYEDRDKAAQREISRNESYEGDRSIRQRDERRSRLLHRSTERRDFHKNWEREGRAKWNANQSALCRYERRLLNYELAVRATAQARQRISRARHADDQADGVRWFEHNLDRLGLDPGGDVGAGGGGTLLPDKETTATFRSRLVRAVLDQKFVPSSNAETMAELRFRGITGRRGRQEREHRRVKTEVDQRRAKAETDAQRAADRHLKEMLDDGRERREVAAFFWKKRHNLEQEAISDNERCADMAAAQEDAFETAFNLRAARARASYEASSAERAAKAEVLRARLRRNSEEKRRRVEVTCAQVVHKIVDLAVVASDTRAGQGGVPLPPTTWGHLKRWFCSADPFFVDESPIEPPPVPADPALDAKTAIEIRNLDRYEGCWRLSDGLPPELRDEPPPLSRALSVARDLLQGSGKGPREPPTYGRRGRGRAPYGSDEETSVRLIILGRRDGLGSLCAELGGWVNLYVCSLETALECAMDVGVEAAKSGGKGGKGRKGSASGRKNSSAGGDEIAEAEAALALEKAKEAAMQQKCFHPDATEEDVEAFKAAAVAYHAVRTHPKKALAPVPPATTTDLLVKHLRCRAPRGRGWILAGYPSSLLESKLLENALSGYTDEQVAAELGTGAKPSKPDAKAKKGSMVPQQQEEEPHFPPRSGLDAVLNLPRLRSAVTPRAEQPAGLSAGTEEGDLVAGVNCDDLKQAAGDGGGIGQGLEEEEGHGEESDSFKERDELTAWWQGFEGGSLVCEVPNEANDERLLENLFLLVNIAQNRKDDHEKWMLDTASARKRLEDEAAQALEGGDSAEPGGGDAAVVERPSPLAVPLTASLEDLRAERRAGMSHSTRIQVEALTGDRKLDLEAVQSTVSEADARQGGSDVPAAIPADDATASSCPPSFAAAMKNLEAECPALSVVGWAANALFSFCGELRAPDDRWTTACLRLERQIEGWVTRMDQAHAAAPSNVNRTRGGVGVGRGRGAKRDNGNGGRSATTFATPAAEGDAVWEALETFQLEAGDVVDDRHCSVEATTREIDAEADQKVQAWIGDIENAAADLCAAERTSYLGTVETLRALDGLFGLEEEGVSSAGAARAREAVREAADALSKGLSPTSGEHASASEGGRLQEEVRRAVQDVYRQDRAASSAQEPLRAFAAQALGGDGNQQAALPSGGLGGVEEGTEGSSGRGDDSAEALGNPTSGGPEPSTDAARGGQDKGERESVALTRAIWRCQLTYICRLRGVVMRLVRAVRGCEAKVASMRAALRRLKRSRVQLEHEGFSVAASMVRRALEECDHEIIEDILENGVPVWIEDEKTFAADPCVALSWGMCGLGLPDVMGLAHALRRGLMGAGSEARGAVVAVSDLSRAVSTWTHSGSREDLPKAWTGSSTGYVDALCEAIAGGTNTGEVPWRRLLHALLLGHVRSLPTVDDLRSMRHAFSLKASTASRASTGEPLSRPPASKGTEDAATAPAASAAQAQAPTLRIAQRHLSGIPFWFERQEDETERRGERAGNDGGWSSTIRAVYADAWGEDDGRVDGLDLLLTLCAVPGDAAPDGGVAGGDGDGEGGIPFSPGLFRAFAVLAESPLSSGTAAPNSGGLGLLPPDGATTTAAAVAAPHGKTGATAGVPRVSLPNLAAILEHGGGMTPADVSGVWEAVVASKENASPSQGEMQAPVQKKSAPPTAASEAAATGKDDPATGLEPDGAGGSTGEGVEGTATIPQRLHDEPNDVHATAGDETDEACEGANKAAPADGSAGARDFSAAGAHDQLMNQDQAALTVSFTAVSECKAVTELPS
eukprot:g9831.t1